MRSSQRVREWLRVLNHQPLANLNTVQFTATILAFLTVAFFLAASGLTRLSELYGSVISNRLNAAAAAPLAYGVSLSGVAARLVTSEPPGGLAIFRADSLTSSRQTTRLCALARSAGDNAVAVAFVALAGEPAACDSYAKEPIRLTAREAGIVSRALAGSRWVLLDPQGKVLYSSRDLPSWTDVREISALFRSNDRGPAL